MWPFDYFKKKKEAARLKLEAEMERKAEEARIQKIELKKKYLIRKEYVDAFVKNLEDEQNKLRRKRAAELREINKLANSTCPNCKSKNVYHAYKRQKGAVDGHLSANTSHYASSTHALFAGSSHSSFSSKAIGDLHGEFDTFKVNKCNDCNHEWEIKDEYITFPDYWPGKIDYERDVPRFLDQVLDVIEHVSNFDPTNLSETCETVEEYIQKEVTGLFNYFDGIKCLTIELLAYYAHRYSYKLVNEDEILGGTWKTRNYKEDCYLKTFPEDIEKPLMEWFGFKKHFNE